MSEPGVQPIYPASPNIFNTPVELPTTQTSTPPPSAHHRNRRVEDEQPETPCPPRKYDLSSRRAGVAARDAHCSNDIENLFGRELKSFIEGSLDVGKLKEAVTDLVGSSIALDGDGEDGRHRNHEHDRVDAIEKIVKCISSYAELITSCSRELSIATGSMHHIVAVGHRNVHLAMTRPPTFWNWLWKSTARDAKNGPSLSVGDDARENARKMKEWKDGLEENDIEEFIPMYRDYLRNEWKQTFRDNRGLIKRQRALLETSIQNFAEATSFRYIFIGVEKTLAKDRQIMALSDDSDITKAWARALDNEKFGARHFANLHWANLVTTDFAGRVPHAGVDGASTGSEFIYTSNTSLDDIIDRRVDGVFASEMRRLHPDVDNWQPSDIAQPRAANTLGVGHDQQATKGASPNKTAKRDGGRSQFGDWMRKRMVQDLDCREVVKLPKYNDYDRRLGLEYRATLWVRRNKDGGFCRNDLKRPWKEMRKGREAMKVSAVMRAFESRDIRFERGYSCPWTELRPGEVIEGPEWWHGEVGIPVDPPIWWARDG